MPKIIENLRERLIDEAKKQLQENGYAKTTIRSIAKGCDVGTGTVYNYFTSKEMLFASFMSEDWRKILSEYAVYDTEDPHECMESIVNALNKFIEAHYYLFDDNDAWITFTSFYSERHSHLRQQIADVLMQMCEKNNKKDPFFSLFIAESLLVWTSEGKSFEDQYSILRYLFL